MTNALINNVQIINDTSGMPAFVVIPYTDFLALNTKSQGLTPHSVVCAVINDDTPTKAWRKHLGLSQAEVAKKNENKSIGSRST